MILPILAYNHPTLRKKADIVEKDYPDLQQLILDMKETLKKSEGVGLAAPQVNKSIRLFIVDATYYASKYPETKEFTKTFINPQIIEMSENTVYMPEGCLSIPGIYEDISRPETITIQYFDENWQEHTETYSTIIARIIQHEYDHLEGILFTDKVPMIRKVFLKKKLENIYSGDISVDYPMIFSKKKIKQK
ncbi:MAG: peptide deformylase [Bacteroidales bacterium]|jgi:peptide deformylase|nr:peptide deformylase [Bacteroidales bacterium]